LAVPISVISLRRYPVKSMGGESLGEVELGARGSVGDRWYAVEDDEGSFASGKDTRRFRRRDAVFEYAAHTEPGGRERVPRCRMIDIRQHGAEPGSRWLKSLAQERGMSLAVYADVSQPGRINLGDQPQPI
jgi:hypothetical protein